MHGRVTLSKKTLLHETFCWKKLLSPKEMFLFFVRQIVLSNQKCCPAWKGVLINQSYYLEHLIKLNLRAAILLIFKNTYMWSLFVYGSSSVAS